MSAPYTYESSLRVHRQGFYDWLGGLRVDYPDDVGGLWTQRQNWPILRVFSTPDRVFANVSDLMISQGWFKDQSSANAMSNAAKDVTILPLPVATIVMGDPAMDPEFASAVKRPQRSYNTGTNQWERHPWPGHYRTPFTVTFWCRKGYTNDHIREWVYSHFGNIGAGNSETFIPVKHALPWGTMQQALRMDGSDDQSVLEGSDPRYYRFSFNFSLRTWVMKMTEVEVSRVESVVVDPSGTVLPDSEEADPDPDITQSFTTYETSNLFTIPLPSDKIPTLWPKTGAATVARAAGLRDQLSVVVASADDSVDLGEWLTEPDTSQSVFSVWFDYLSNGPVLLVAGDRQPVDEMRVEAVIGTIPKSPSLSPVHKFALFDKRVGSFAIVGTGARAAIRLRNVHVSRVAPQGQTAPTSTTSTGVRWDSLSSVPYLVCLKVTAADLGDSVTIQDDVTAPVHSKSQRADTAVGAGLVFLMQPQQASLRLIWPSTTTVAIAWVQRYYSSYHGDAGG